MGPATEYHLEANYKDEVHSVAFSPDGGTLVSGTDAPTVKLWDLSSGGVRRVRTRQEGIMSTVFSPDGRLVASASGSSIQLFDVSTGRELRTLPGPIGVVTSIVFSPDGRTRGRGMAWDGSSVGLRQRSVAP